VVNLTTTNSLGGTGSGLEVRPIEVRPAGAGTGSDPHWRSPDGGPLQPERLLQTAKL